jgi:hypothetical protein
MNVQIRCEAILSKKLEKIAEAGEPIEIRIAAVKGNKAEAVIRIVTNKSAVLDEIRKLGETNIGFKISDAGEEAPNIVDDKPLHMLFAKEAVITPSSPTPVTVTPASKSTETPIPKNAAIKTAIVPPPAPVTNLTKPIMNYAEMMEALMQVKDVDQPMPTARAKDGSERMSRQEAQEFEEKILNLPRLIRPVYVGNLSTGSIVVNDLNQTIELGQIFDLSKVPARRILESKDLRGLLLKNILKFCTEDEYLKHINALDPTNISKHESLPTGSREEMEALMEKGYIPEEISQKKGPKAIAITADHREAEPIDLDEDPEMEQEMEQELQIFEQISTSPSADFPPAAKKIIHKPSSSVKSIRRAE